MSLNIDLSGRRAFVSGVTSGIGAAIAAKLAEAGCDVAGSGRSQEEAAGEEAFRHVVTSFGRRCFYSYGDLSQKETPARLIQEAVEALGGLDILVSNAGRNVFAGAANCSEQQWQECIDLDLAAPWRLAKEARSYLEGCAHRQGVIIVIGSNHAFHTIKGCFPYNVAKAGLLAMVQSLAIEWGPRIRAIGVAPGFVDTPANEKWFANFEDPEEERRRTEQSHPVGRISTPDEIGALCVFLASDYNAFMSGTTLLVDGGRSAILQDSCECSEKARHRS